MTGLPGQEFDVLIVCTGNVCRSPAIEALLRAELGSGGVVVQSAGTRALVGEPIQPSMRRLLQGTGINGEGFAARLLTEAMVAQSDLILTATREHRAEVVEETPAALRRTFSVREFARLASRVEPGRLDGGAAADGSAAERLSALVPLAAAHRSQVSADLDDIVDPYGRSDAVYLESFSQICEAIGTIVQVVLGHRGRNRWEPGLGSGNA